MFCIRDYISRIRIRSILIEFLETSDCTDESRKDETCLQFKMNKYFIKTRKMSLKKRFQYATPGHELIGQWFNPKIR